MEVRKGYKQTEVGEIPQDWIPTPISKIASVRGRVGWKGYTKKDLVQQGPLTIGATQINKNNRLDLSNPTFLSREKYLESPEIMVEYKDILIVQRGSTIGKLVLIDQEIGEATINPSLVIVRTQKISPGFVAYYLLSAAGQKQILTDLSSTGVPMISQRQIGNFLVPLPPTLAEQEAIAEALSDADALIESLEILLAKKRQVKQGAMSELLTGKRRVVESPTGRLRTGEWKVKTIGELGNCFAGGTPSTFNSAFWNGDIFWLPSGRVQNCILDNPIDDEIKITKLGLQNSAAKLIKAHSVLVAITGATCGNIACLEFEAAANQSVVAIEPNNNVNYRFLYYSLLMKRNAILSLQSGSAQGGVNLRAVKSIIIDCPSLAEQTAIAKILSDMDKEIRAVEEKLSKARAVKAGMMSALLGGRVRLNRD